MCSSGTAEPSSQLEMFSKDQTITVENSGEKPALTWELHKQECSDSYFSRLSKKKKNAEPFTGSIADEAVASMFWHKDTTDHSLPHRVTVNTGDFL